MVSHEPTPWWIWAGLCAILAASIVVFVATGNPEDAWFTFFGAIFVVWLINDMVIEPLMEWVENRVRRRVEKERRAGTTPR